MSGKDETLITSIANRSKDTGYITFIHDKFRNYAIGRWRTRILYLLYLVGFATAVTWIVLAALASVPTSDDMATSDLSVIFTVMMSVHLAVFSVATAVLIIAIARQGARMNAPKKGGFGKATKAMWDIISIPNRRRIKLAVILILIGMIGLMTSQITFMVAENQPFNTYFSEVMFDNTTTITQTNITAIAGTCSTTISTACLADEFDDYAAQSFINVNHVCIVMNFIIAFAYWTLFWNIFWLQGQTVKYADVDGYNISIVGEAGSRGVEIDVAGSKKTQFIYTIQRSEGASKDISLNLVALLLVVTNLFALTLLMFQLLTVSGLYNGLCRFLDDYLIFWLTDFTFLGVLLFFLVALWGAIDLKKTTSQDIDICQASLLKYTVYAVVFIGIIVGSTGFMWLIAESSTEVTGIPTAVMCRVAGAFKGYNANKVMEILMFTFLMYVTTDYYFLHCAKISHISLFKSLAMAGKEALD